MSPSVRRAAFGPGLVSVLALVACGPRVQTRPDPVVEPGAQGAPAAEPVRAPSTPPPPAAGPREVPPSFHVVKAGDTLWRVARAHGTTPAELAAANGLSQSAPLSIGQKLRLPGPPTSLAAVASAAREAAEAAGDPKAVTRPSGPAPLDWPLIGVLYARFGPRGEARHDGLDIAAPEGSVVRAAGDGTVLYAGEQRGYGQVIILEHREGLLTIYSHNQETLVLEGRTVKVGEPIAKVGPGGRTSGPHLHFEVREKGRPKDPLLFLPPPR